MISISWILSETEDAYIKVSQRELSVEETPSNELVIEEKLMIISFSVLSTKPNITVIIVMNSGLFKWYSSLQVLYIKYLNILLQKQKYYQYFFFTYLVYFIWFKSKLDIIYQKFQYYLSSSKRLKII